MDIFAYFRGDLSFILPKKIYACFITFLWWNSSKKKREAIFFRENTNFWTIEPFIQTLIFIFHEQSIFRKMKNVLKCQNLLDLLEKHFYQKNLCSMLEWYQRANICVLMVTQPRSPPPSDAHLRHWAVADRRTIAARLSVSLLGN